MTSATEPRRWLITGANSGFGAAFTRAALAAGDLVVAAVRRPGTLAGLAADHPGRLTVVPLDVTDAEQCRLAVQSAEAAHGHVDILVNNAGFGTVGAVEETTEAELRRAMEVMFFAPMRLTGLVLPGMRRRRSGTVVQVTSMGGLLAFAGVGAYCAAKGALEQAGEALAAEVAPLGLRVLLAEPGAFRTEFNGALQSSRALPDYDATVGPVREGLATGHGTQPGDPDKAAAALLTALALPEPPLRLALGDDAVSAIRAKLARVEADIAATEHFTTGTAVNFP
ncbi:SDR family NAD(P)-dependent oxidoreductase [Streptomyces sp. DSM 44917]|uniref:SDR family NAD(P)-dependent oxidoreductase n=1 Tax=Streptomyces boetiae TaxID=3075541 RepID=A0ABU2LD26_9ACTN|nr:SDR family NAD(P)-dependent oxidoreductase [Streptomyces sp. DSM 44917]MDT0309484.1 SDR family NAD(P)-dependent oxidoreductase [Streptomyces sp. DSM 44917]